MDSEIRQLWYLHIAYIFFWTLIFALIFYPIGTTYPEFPFLRSNMAFVMTLACIIYLILFHQFLNVLKNKWVKIVLILILPLLMFNVYYQIADFNFYIDRNKILDDLYHLPYEQQQGLAKFVRREYLMSSIAVFICLIVLLFRLIRLLRMQIKAN